MSVEADVRLFYRDGERMTAVALTTSRAFQPQSARLLFEGHFEGSETSSAVWATPPLPDRVRAAWRMPFSQPPTNDAGRWTLCRD
jgi:hypothetical protein